MATEAPQSRVGLKVRGLTPPNAASPQEACDPDGIQFVWIKCIKRILQS